MSHSQSKVILAFDPGATTGVAVVTSKKVVHTYALDAGLVQRYARRLRSKYRGATVVIESSPKWRHNSPLTKNVEEMLKKTFPNAALVPPNQWKGSPHAQCPEQLPTTHQRDAVRLARWFMAKRSTDGEGHKAIEDQASSSTKTADAA